MRERLRFVNFKLDRLPSGECRVRVTLAWPEGPSFDGEARGLTSQAGELRCAAQAALLALAQAVREVNFELVGVKSIRAFDATVVIVSLGVPGGSEIPRVVGSYLTEGDAPRGAALAVLNATNRLLARQKPSEK
jgi:hypothetical protein